MRVKNVSIVDFFSLGQLVEIAAHALRQVQMLTPSVALDMDAQDALKELWLSPDWCKPHLKPAAGLPAKRSYALKVAVQWLRKKALGSMPPGDFALAAGEVHEGSSRKRSCRRVQAMRRQSYDAPEAVRGFYLRCSEESSPETRYSAMEMNTVIQERCPMLRDLTDGVSLLELKHRLSGAPGSMGCTNRFFEMAMREECLEYARLSGESFEEVWVRTSKVLAKTNGTRGKYAPRKKPAKSRKPKVESSLRV